MNRPLRESTQSDINANYIEFMRRMYVDSDHINPIGLSKIILISAGIVACIAILIYQLS